MAEKPTVFDVARIAGVSRGTVDRVVNRRGKVSPEALERVGKAIELLGYERNEGASNLARKKVLHIATLTPQPMEADYWRQIDNGFRQGEEAVRRFHNIILSRHYYDQTSLQSFEKAAEEIIAEEPQGVILTSIFKYATRNLSAELHSRKIPYAFIDTLDEGLPYVMHYGVNPGKSGVLGAYLLCLAAQKPQSVAIVCIRRDNIQTEDPNECRKRAFVRYICEHFPECKLYQIFLNADSEDNATASMEEFAADHPEVHNFGVVSSRTYLLRKYLSAHPDPERVVVGFDDLDGNIEALREGLVTFLVTRHIPHQSRDILVDFAKYLSGNPAPKDRNIFVHMDILSKLNIDDY